MIKPNDMVARIEEAVMAYQDENTTENNETAICVGIEPCSDDMAEMLGLELNACVPFYGGDAVSTAKYINRDFAIPMQDLALALVRQQMRADGVDETTEPIVSARVDSYLPEGGCVTSCTIWSEKGQASPECRVYIAVCDLSRVCSSFLSSAVDAGKEALREYIDTEQPNLSVSNVV